MPMDVNNRQSGIFWPLEQGNTTYKNHLNKFTVFVHCRGDVYFVAGKCKVVLMPATKTYGRVEFLSYSVLTWTIGGGERSVSLPVLFTRTTDTLPTQWRGGRVGPTACRDVLEKSCCLSEVAVIARRLVTGRTTITFPA